MRKFSPSGLVLCLVCLLTLVWVAAAHATPQCGQHDKVAEALKSQFGEVVQMQGLTSDGRLGEVWANPETGTGPSTMTTPQGMTCLSGAGDQFQIKKPGDPA